MLYERLSVRSFVFCSIHTGRVTAATRTFKNIISESLALSHDTLTLILTLKLTLTLTPNLNLALALTLTLNLNLDLNTYAFEPFRNELGPPSSKQTCGKIEVLEWATALESCSNGHRPRRPQGILRDIERH